MREVKTGVVVYLTDGRLAPEEGQQLEVKVNGVPVACEEDGSAQIEGKAKRGDHLTVRVSWAPEDERDFSGTTVEFFVSYVNSAEVQGVLGLPPK